MCHVAVPTNDGVQWERSRGRDWVCRLGCTCVNRCGIRWVVVYKVRVSSTLKRSSQATTQHMPQSFKYVSARY
jgi:hypothetical protein